MSEKVWYTQKDMFRPDAAFSGFSVNNLEKAKEFYHEVLGLTVEEERDMGLLVHLPGTAATVFVYSKPNHTAASYTVLNFVVDDIDVAVEALSKKGVVFEHYHMKEMPQDEKGILRGTRDNEPESIAWFKDPAGNIFSLLQERK